MKTPFVTVMRTQGARRRNQEARKYLKERVFQLKLNQAMFGIWEREKRFARNLLVPRDDVRQA